MQLFAKLLSANMANYNVRLLYVCAGKQFLLQETEKLRVEPLPCTHSLQRKM